MSSPALVAVLLGVGVVVLGVPLWWVATSDRLAARVRRIEACAAWTEGRLRRRHELVRSLVLLVEGCAPHAGPALDEVTAARAGAVAALGGHRLRQSGAEAFLGRSLARLLAVTQEHPALRAHAGLAALRRELDRTEDDIARARRVLNDAVLALERDRRSFPASVVARARRIGPGQVLRSVDHRRAAVATPARTVLPAVLPSAQPSALPPVPPPVLPRPLVPAARAQQDDPRPGARP